MPQVSKIKLDKKTERKLSALLTLILSKINKEPEMDYFLASLMTPTEKLMLAKRIAAVVLINQGLNDSQIASSLHLTRVTVAKLRYFREARGEGYSIVFKILRNQKIGKEVQQLLIELARYSVKAVSYGM